MGPVRLFAPRSEAPVWARRAAQIRWPICVLEGLYRGMQGRPATAQPAAALAEDRLLRPEQAAWYLNVKTSWVYEAVRAGRLPCHRVGRHIRFTRPMLDEWLAEQVRQ